MVLIRPFFSTKVRSLRLKRKVDGLEFDFKNLYYLSVHYCPTPKSIQVDYAKARLESECTEDWIRKSLSWAGIEFDDKQSALTEDELTSIAGASLVTNVDKLKFEICVRSGTEILVHPDELNYWKLQDSDSRAIVDKLVDDHNKLYKGMISHIIERQTIQATGIKEELLDDPGAADDDDKGNTGEINIADFEFESVTALEHADGPLVKLPSEVPEVDLMRGKGGSTYLLSAKGRSVAKHTQLGGMGTGRFVPADSAPAGTVFDFEKGDKTLIQIDHASITPDNTNIEVATMYRYLTTLEKKKKTTSYQASSNVLRRFLGDDV